MRHLGSWRAVLSVEFLEGAQLLFLSLPQRKDTGRAVGAGAGTVRRN